MNKSLKITAATLLLFSSMTSYATTTFYCAPTSQITFTAQQNEPWAPYLYTSPAATVNNGTQPALTGWGFASQVVQLSSAEWTDGSLACNYDGLTDQQQSEFMVMVSSPLYQDWATCHFPTNDNKSFCNSTDPYACPMVCDGELHR